MIGIDGKTARRSHNKGAGIGPLHLVSAWASRNRLVLGQVKVDEKSNELTAVPELLQLLDLRGCIVTVDALNTQKEIAREVREQGADYVMALKGNHPTLYNEVQGIFEAVREDDTADGVISTTESVEANHGRTETRRCWSVEAPNWITGFDQWRDLQSLILVEATREIKGQSTTELRYYLSSLPPDAVRAAHEEREDWGVENSLHWVLDVAFSGTGRAHQYFINRLSSGWIEGLNSKIKVFKRRCYSLSNIGNLFRRICLDLKGRAVFA